MKKGKLFLIPTFLIPDSDTNTLPPANLIILNKLTVFIVENVRTARRMLRKVGYDNDFDTITFFELNKHTDPATAAGFISPALKGNDIGLLSEAGAPGIADPGAEIVSLAHQHGIRVVPLSGPSSIILALMASGLNGQNFVFHGYLPIDKKERSKKLQEIESRSKVENQTQVFIETPYRNNQMLDAIIKYCHPSTKLCVACEIMHPDRESIHTTTVEAWSIRKPDLHKRPAVFLL